MNAAGILLIIFAALIAIPLAVVLIIYVVVPVVRLLARLIAHVVRFIAREITDTLRIIGALVTSLVLVPLVVLNVVLGRWSASSHFGHAFLGELRNAALALYRVVIAHPAALLGLTSLTEGLEKRLPQVIAAAPGKDSPSKRTGAFDGYDIVGSLAGGGSGGKLYVARPDATRLAAFRRAGRDDVREVVIKSFSLSDGSSLPQIVRESRALDAARRLGLVLDHELTDERFYYVMRYVPGEPLGLVTQRLHAASPHDGLANPQLAQSLSFAADLLRTLDSYHSGGLWHKDVKPDNIIVDGSCAHLVDLGLITPLRSAMTLTTHGTEYFRDPEMVRLALRGVKVHQVDGAKFDVYAAGAVLYSMIEGSFPAHGGLSQISKRCPEAVRWVVRRAMTDYDKRYASAAAMLADVEAVLASDDPFAMKPIALPSMGGPAPAVSLQPEQVAHTPVPPPLPRQTVQSSSTPPSINPASQPAPRSRPAIRVADWWTGRYVVAGSPVEPAAAAAQPAGFRPIRGASPFSAQEQLRRARERAEAARSRALEHAAGVRTARRTPPRPAHSNGPNAGMAMAVMVFLAVGVFGGMSLLNYARRAKAAFDPAALADVGSPIPPAAPSTPAESVDGERLLVLRDPISFAPGVRDSIEPALRRLAESGFELVGAFDDEDPEEAAAQTEAIASLRKALGLAPFRSEEARSALAAYLAAQADAPAVIWIGRGARDDAPDTWMVEAPDAPRNVVRVARRVLGGER